MSELEKRIDRLESLVEQQQETTQRQQERIDAQQETIERQAAVIERLRSDDESADGPGGASISRRGAMKAAGLVGLLGVGAGAATAGPTIGAPGNQVETLYAQGLAGDLTGGTTVTDLVGGGLTVESGSLTPALSSDLTLSDGNLAVDVGPGDVGAAPGTHDNTAHAQTYAIDGAAQPPEAHGNEAHSSNFATTGEVPTSPSDIGAAADSHGNEAHSSDFATSGEVPTSPGDIGAAADSHGNGAHSTTFVSSLSGGAGISQGTIGQGDTVSVTWEDASGLNSSGQPVDFGAANDLGSGGSITDFSGANDLDGSGNLANFGDANNLDSNGNVQWGSANGLQSDGSVDESQLSVGVPPYLVQSVSDNQGSNSASGGRGTTVLGGINNTAIGDDSFSGDGGTVVGGGVDNTAESDAGGFIGAGTYNEIQGGAQGEAIVAGTNNTLTSGSTGFRMFIGAGSGNTIEDSSSTSSNAADSAIVAGDDNTIDGTSNFVAESFIGAGENNTISGSQDGIVTADGETKAGFGTIAGGYENQVASNFGGVLNGSNNEVAGDYATVPGGADNTARGRFSFAFGHNATVEDDGAVVFADSTEREAVSNGPDTVTFQMEAHAPELRRAVPDSRLDTELDAAAALDRLTGLAVGGDDEGLALDPEGFNEAFDIDGDGLGTLDVDAALLGAVQALAAEVERLKQDIETARDTQ